MNPIKSSTNAIHELLSMALEAMPSGVIVANDFGEIVFVNHEIQRLFCYESNELLNQPIEILLPERFRAEHPHLRDGFFSDRTTRRLGMGRELLARRKDGSEIPVEIGLNPFTTSQGSFVLAVVVDVSERFREAEKISRDQQLAAIQLAEDAEMARRKAEQIEERLNLAMKSSGVGTWDWDLVEDTIHWDDYVHELFGIEHGTFSGKFTDFEKLAHPDDTAQVAIDVKSAIKHDVPFDREFRVIWPDQSVHSLSCRGKVYRDADGKPLRMIGVCWDITDHKESASALAMANSQLAGVLDASTQVAIIATDVNGLITVFNSGAENLLGYTADEIVDKQSPAILHVAEEVNARGEELSRELGYAVEGFDVFVNPAKRGLFDRRQWTYVRKDGSRFPVRLVVTAVKDATGTITGFLGVGEDITESLKMLERVRAIVDAAPMAMLVVDASGNIMLANRQADEMFGYDRGELSGQQADVLVPRRYRTKLPNHRKKYFQNPVQRDMSEAFSLYGLRKDGSKFPTQVGLSSIDTDDGPAVICGIRDVTNEKLAIETLRAAKESAESASRAKSSFLANMSHEIRTPMNGIIGMSQLLAQTELGANQREYLATVDESAHILLRLLNDILDFSKIEAGKLELECVEFQLSECLARASRLFVLRAAEKGLEIVCRVAPEIPDRLMGDAGRIQQVLVNLLSNAVKFTTAGKVCVNVYPETISSKSVQLHFSVSDTGIGIPAEKIELVFRPFEQAEASTTRRFGGTGLGLTISKQLVEKMQGRIWVESELGHGSVFHFTALLGIPEAQNHYQPAELNSLSLIGSSPTVAPRRILLVEDNEINRRVALGLLNSRGHQATVAVNGKQAVELLAEQEFDVVLMDMQMPVMDGYEATIEIRNRERETGGHIPIVAMTAEALKGDRERCLEVGMDDYVSKPVVPEEMYLAIERFPAICLSMDSVASVVSRPSKAGMNKKHSNEKAEDVAVPSAFNSQPTVNWMVAQELLPGGPEGLAQFISLVAKEAPEHLAAIRKSIVERDAKTLQRSAHTLKSSVSYFGAAELVELAIAMENHGKNASFEQAETLFTKIQQQVARVVLELNSYRPEDA
jgi:PAS domain S-box-containing protein